MTPRLPLILTPFAVMFLTHPARAELRVCNETASDANIAIGYKGAEDWTSEGWWGIKAGACATVLAGDLKNQYYYWHAMSANGALPSENYTFCTSDQAFTIVGDKNCENRGHTSASFSQVDTGDAKSYTISIAAPGTYGRISGGNEGAANGTVMSVIFSHCDATDDSLQCAFHANGRRYIASSAGATQMAILEQLDRTPILTPVNLTYDVTSRGDVTDMIVIHDISHGQQDGYARVRKALQGFWQDAGDDEFKMLIHGTTLKDIFLNLDGIDAFWEIAETCEGANGAGPVMLLTYYDPPPTQTSCWVLLGLNSSQLTFRAIGGSKDQVYEKKN